mmetsp:Transcript_1215/g.1365  ORF Transcript_1215/g.1365 Transcript_1215/m.1365 type:complete len:85 (+) Transcript_1215:1167-1421(+)
MVSNHTNLHGTDFKSNFSTRIAQFLRKNGGNNLAQFYSLLIVVLSHLLLFHKDVRDLDADEYFGNRIFNQTFTLFNMKCHDRTF